MLKKIWDWIWDIDSVRSDIVIETSISGKPLLKFRSSLSGWSMSNTDEGLQGAHISITITQLGNNVSTIKALLRGEYQNYLSYQQYNRLVMAIEHRIADGGYYLSSARNAAGTLDFVRVYWDTEDREEIIALMQEYKSDKM